jgi:ABC-type branched-subunit amino acid transport system substrate-binding protein
VPVAGRRIKIISADHQDKPDVGVAIVRDWIDNKHVDVIAEGVTSSVALAIQNLTCECKKLFLISGSGSSDLTGKQCSPTSVQWTYDTYASRCPYLVNQAERGSGKQAALMQPKKDATGWPRRVPTLANSLVQALRAPCCQAHTGLAGDPSEVTALGKRHWITSFRC